MKHREGCVTSVQPLMRLYPVKNWENTWQPTAKRKPCTKEARGFNTLSRTTFEPYTILLEQGEIIEERPKIIPFQAEADSESIREARKAVNDQGQESRVQLTTGCRVIESESRFKRVDERSKWEQYPQELLDNPVALLDWFEDKCQAVGLSGDERDHVQHLKREFPRQFEAWQDMQKEKRHWECRLLKFLKIMEINFNEKCIRTDAKCQDFCGRGIQPGEPGRRRARACPGMGN